MQSLKGKSVIDNKIMSLTKVNELRHIIAHTDKGDLCLLLKKGESERDYRFILDAVPYEDKENKELLELFNGSLFTI